ncbi:g7552 [Coccomyxa viridis]|uniref:G7552 protein n=1 Tax=Coccomyxa viridis TaxID=1274662 RepID=A0ABP1G4S3_9CHLO
MQLDTCSLLERLNVSHCTRLTDASLNGLADSKAVAYGRLWDLDISDLGPGFTGAGLSALLIEWTRTQRYVDVIPAPSTWEEDAPGYRLNISYNDKILAEHLLGLVALPGMPCVQFGQFLADDCSKMAAPLILGTYSLNVLGEVANSGSFDQLQTLDLRRCFAASTQESLEKNEAALARIIRGTGGRLKRLLIDDGCAGADVVEAIASKGSQLEELSICDCRGVSDAGLQALAAACKQLTRLYVGGDSRCLDTV